MDTGGAGDPDVGDPDVPVGDPGLPVPVGDPACVGNVPGTGSPGRGAFTRCRSRLQSSAFGSLGSAASAACASDTFPASHARVLGNARVAMAASTSTFSRPSASKCEEGSGRSRRMANLCRAHRTPSAPLASGDSVASAAFPQSRCTTRSSVKQKRKESTTACAMDLAADLKSPRREASTAASVFSVSPFTISSARREASFEADGDSNRRIMATAPRSASPRTAPAPSGSFAAVLSAGAMASSLNESSATTSAAPRTCSGHRDLSSLRSSATSAKGRFTSSAQSPSRIVDMDSTACAQNARSICSRTRASTEFSDSEIGAGFRVESPG